MESSVFMPAKADRPALTGVETIYQQHYSRIYGILYRLLGNQADAEDASQQLFLKLYQTPPDQLPVDETKLVGWLYHVALNAGYNTLRGQKRRTAWHERFDRLWPFSRSAPDPAHLVEQQDAQAQVQRILTQMKPRDAKLLLLRHAGLSYKELASALDIPLSSVGSLLTEARRKFARKYQAVFKEEG